MKSISILSTMVLLKIFLCANNVNASEIIKTKCYKTESPTGEVCIFEDKRALGPNKNKYQDRCEEAAKLPYKNLIESELRVTDSSGKETDRQKIPALTSLNLLKVRVNNSKTFSTSYTNSACSIFSGDGNTPFWVNNGKILFLIVDNNRVNFMNTLRKTWFPVADGFLEATSSFASEKEFPKGEGWATSYIRYQYLNNSWVVKKTIKSGWSEFEPPPNESDFPSRLSK
jgi:hypothetical protein